MKKYTFLLLLLLLVGSACNQTVKEASAIHVRTDSGFLVYKGEFSNDQVAIKSVSYANQQSGEVLVEFNLLNKGDKPLLVKYLLTELTTPEGLRSSPDYPEEFPNELLEGQEASYSLKFMPTNSRRLVAEIGYNGDLEKSYEVDLEFIGLKGEKLRLIADETAYADYVLNYGLEESIRIYHVANKEAWLTKQKACLPKVNSKEQAASVALHDQELLIQGVVCKLSMYSSKGELKLSLRMANQSEQLINAVAELLQIKANGQVLEATSIDVLTSNRKNPKGKGAVLRKSERYQVNYIYKITDNQLVELTDLGVYLEEDEKSPLLCAPLQFEIPAM